MEIENFFTSLKNKLQEKSHDNTTYRKAIAIFESLVEATKAIPSFQTQYGNNNSNLALYIFGAIFKLILKVTSGKDKKYEFNMDCYLLLLNYSIAEINIGVLKQTGLLTQFQHCMFELLKNKDKTPIMTRLLISLLSHTFMCEIEQINFQTDQPKKEVVLSLFENAVQSHRSNIMSKQCSRLLVHLAKNNESVIKIVSEEAKKSLLSNLENRKQLFLNNVKDLVREFPVRLINDIAYRTAKNLSEIDHNDINNEQYLTQTYFFLEKVTDKLLATTLEQILKELIVNVPTSAESDKIIYCYLQLIYQVSVSLFNTEERTFNKFLASIIGIYQEFILANKKVERFATNLLSFLITNCIRPSLWTQNQQINAEDDLFQIENLGLDEAEGHSYGKVICMMKGMLSHRFSNTKVTANILSQFFNQLNHTIFSETLELVQKSIDFRTEVDDRSFKKIVHSIFNGFGINEILKIYPISVEGDISKPNFENDNNLWILSCIEKYEGEELMETFSKHFLPLLYRLKQFEIDVNLHKARKQGYKMISEMLWRSFKVFCKKINKKINYEQILQLIDTQINQISDNTLDHISIGLEFVCQKLYAMEYKSTTSEKLIKNLASILDINKNNSIQILRAIKSLSLITNREYTQRVFDKNIAKIIQLQEKHKLLQEEEKNYKNLQILISVSAGVNFSDSSIVTSYKVSREQLVVKLASGLIGEQNNFQKKGFKLIYETIDLMPRSFTLEIVELIQSNQKKILASSKHYRLSILRKLWESLNHGEIQENIEHIFNFIKSYLPEILIALRENNKRARKEAIDLFDSFTNRIIELGLLQNFIEIMCAGFASNRVETKLATLAGLNIIISNQEINKNEEFFNDVLDIVLLLLKEKKQELYKGVVDFCKKIVFLLEKQKQNQLLPNIISLLFVEDQESKMEHRSILKHFLLKLVKKNSRELIQKMIPAQDRKILSNAIKTENREKKKKRQISKMKREEFNRRKKEQQQQSSDDESLDESVNQNKMQIQEEEPEKLQDLDNTNNLLLKYDLEKENFHFEKEKLANHATSERKDRNKDRDDITFNENGLMIIKEQGKRFRQRDDEAQAEDEEKDARAYQNIKKKVKNDVVHQVKQSGDTYKSSRAGGDVKLKDKPEPYAFIQFNSKALNKRFKKKAEKIFDSIFEKKEGGLKGVKSRLSSKTH